MAEHYARWSGKYSVSWCDISLRLFSSGWVFRAICTCPVAPRSICTKSPSHMSIFSCRYDGAYLEKMRSCYRSVFCWSYRTFFSDTELCEVSFTWTAWYRIPRTHWLIIDSDRPPWKRGFCIFTQITSSWYERCWYRDRYLRWWMA